MKEILAAHWWKPSFLIVAFALTGCERTPPEPLTFTEISSPTGEGSAQQRLSVGGAGAVVLSWLEPSAEDYALKYSILDADGWGEARTVVTGDNLFVSWADTPSVVQISEDAWAAHWGVFQADSYFAFDAVVAFSADGGSTWQEPFLLHQDGTETEHGFVFANRPVYKKPASERHWETMLALFDRRLHA